MHEIIAVMKIVFYALLMLSILIIMTLALLSVLNDDMEFSESTIEIKKGRLINIFMKFSLCGVTMIGYIIMMILIR